MMRRGLALVLVAGVIGVMAVMAVAFVTFAQLERRSSGQRLHATRALLLARGGIEDATARLSSGQVPAYGGEDWDLSGTLNGPEIAHAVHGPGVLDVETCPVAHAMRPSFFVTDSLGKPLLALSGARQRGVSGRPGASGSAYVLKVEDESAKLNVNGGLLDAGDRDADGIPDHRDGDVRITTWTSDTGTGWNFQLVRVLNLLGQQAEVGVPNLGSLLVPARPAGGYRTLADVQAAAGTSKDLSPFLTLSSWSDAKVVHPTGFSGQVFPMSLSEVIKARMPLAPESGGRPPVNLNAASRPVLAALLTDLKGTTWFDPSPKPSSAQRTVTIVPAMASRLANTLIARRRTDPFDTWGEFEAWVDTQVPMPIAGMNGIDSGGGNLDGADLVKANFNPNTQLAKTEPDQLMWKFIDKSDLLVWSTEGCLAPTGVFRIACVGRVTAPDGRVLAEVVKDAVVEAYRLLRETTQEDFVAGRKLTDYLSLADPGAFPQTAMACASEAGAVFWGGAPPGGGLGAVTYPAPPTALPAAAAPFDGAVGLATVDLKRDAPPGGSLTFLHHFDDAWDADAGGEPAPMKSYFPGDDKLPADLTQGVWPASSAEPNTLRPDGAHIQWERSPAFHAKGNLPDAESADASNHGVLSYWVKFRGFTSGLTHQVNVLRYRVPTANPLGITDAICEDATQFLRVGTDAHHWGIGGENCLLSSDGLSGSNRERAYDNPFQANGANLHGGGRWHLVTALYDIDEPVLGDDIRVWIQGVVGTGSANPGHKYPVPFDNSAGIIEDLLPDAQTELCLGLHYRVVLTNLGSPMTVGGQVNHVLDEFAVYDFGDAVADAKDNAGKWHDLRFADGRYYKGGDAVFRSQILRPEAGVPVRLLRAWWTQYLPKENRQEILRTNVMPPFGSPRAPDPWLKDDPLAGPRVWIELELTDASGTSLAAMVQGAGLQRAAGAFGYRVKFRTALADLLNDPILETPVFDDVTFAWQSSGGCRVLAWE